MAEKTAADILREIGKRHRAEFRGEPWYNPAGDCMVWYFENRESYAERIDDKLTVYRAFEGKEVVGCQLKGIRALLEKHGVFKVDYQDRGVSLAVLLFVSHFDAEPDDVLACRKPVYNRLIERAGQRTITVPEEDFYAPVGE